jgi:hypothetical protein
MCQAPPGDIGEQLTQLVTRRPMAPTISRSGQAGVIDHPNVNE